MGVGQIKPTPEISVIFKTLATTAIQRSALGILCIILKDETQTEKVVTIKTIDDLDETKWEEKSIKLIKLAMQTYSPNKIIVRVQGSSEQIADCLKDIKYRKINWLACPTASSEEDTTIVTWIKQVFGTTTINKTVKYVSSYADNSDHVAIVELANKGTYKSKLGDFTAQEYTVAVAGMLCGLPLNRSADNLIMQDLTQVDEVEAALGKFSLYNDDGAVRVNMAVNSKTTFDSTWKSDTRFIKIVEGMCIVCDDIRDTFKNYWQGIYINDYDNKMNFCSNVNKVYFKELQPNVLNADYDNKIEIDLEAQKKAIVLDGRYDPNDMSELEILKFGTGADVYLSGDVMFANTMVNLSLEITM
jgi:hypothetical protein